MRLVEGATEGKVLVKVRRLFSGGHEPAQDVGGSERLGAV